ncbi:MAG TPA: MFS transporter [Ilumatobacter sp.]|nr:MFS transporter [Ilumatobacter sp.]
MLFFILLAQLSIVASLASINLTLPELRIELGASDGQLQWALVSEQLAYAVLLIVGGRLGDLYGRRRLYVIGLVGFTGASLLAALAVSPEFVIAARMLQGISGGLGSPQVLAMIRDHFEGEQQARAYAWFSLVSGLGFTIGQVASGVLISSDLFGLGWRLPFLAAALGTFVGLFSPSPPPPIRPKARARDVDVGGALLLAASALLILYPLIQGQEAGWPPVYFVAMALAVPTAVMFVRRQQRRARTGVALVDVRLFKIPTFRVAVCLGAVFSITAMAPFFVLSYTLQSGFGYSAMETALYMAGGPLFMVPASMLSTRAIRRFGRGVYVIGATLSAASAVAVYLVVGAGGAPAQPLWLLPALAMQGFGQGLFLPATTLVLMAHIPGPDASTAAAVHQTASQFAGAIGMASFGVIYFAALGAGTAAQSSAAFSHLVPVTLGCTVALLLASRMIPRSLLGERAPAPVPAPG